jgi:hypothetical protein
MLKNLQNPEKKAIRAKKKTLQFQSVRSTHKNTCVSNTSNG